MKFAKLFRKNSILFAAVIVLSCVFISQPALSEPIVAWGNNDYGQATAPSGDDFVAMSAGWEHNLALKSDGSIFGWGYDGYGQATPPSGFDFVDIAAGWYHSLALKSDGSIVGWGSNWDGETSPPDGFDFVDGAHDLAAGDRADFRVSAIIGQFAFATGDGLENLFQGGVLRFQRQTVSG